MNPSFRPGTVFVDGVSVPGARVTFAQTAADQWATAESVTGAQLRSFGVRVGIMLDTLAVPGIAPVTQGTGEGARSGWSFPMGTLDGYGPTVATLPVVGRGTQRATLRAFTPETERGRYVLALASIARELDAKARATPAVRSAGSYLWRSAGFLDPATITAVLVVGLILGVLYVEEQAVVAENVAVRATQARVVAASADYQARVRAVASGQPDPGPSANERAVVDEVRQRAEREHRALDTIAEGARDTMKTIGYALAAYVLVKALT